MRITGNFHTVTDVVSVVRRVLKPRVEVERELLLAAIEGALAGFETRQYRTANQEARRPNAEHRRNVAITIMRLHWIF